MSHYELGKLAGHEGDEEALRIHWRATLEVFDDMERRGMHVSPSDQGGLKAIRTRVAGEDAVADPE